eukprot:jgi/Botrbrau1/13091/Bobra.0187s0050.1
MPHAWQPFWGGLGKAAATSGITRDGGLDCLHALQRTGCLDLTEAVVCAASRAQVECLKYLLDLDPNLVQEPVLLWTSLCRTGPPGAIIDCMEFLQGAGCQWSREGDELCWAAAWGWVEVLQYCLERNAGPPWDKVMGKAGWGGSVDCMQVLYDNGYEQHRSRDSKDHPAEGVLSRSDSEGPSRPPGVPKACSQAKRQARSPGDFHPRCVPLRR